MSAYHLAYTTMIPGPVSDTNRAEQARWWPATSSARTPRLSPRWTPSTGGYWPTNASITATYQAVVSAALAVLATPPPFAPMAPNPAAALAAVAQAGAQAGVKGALQASSQSMTQTATAGAAAAGGRRAG